MPCAGSEEGQDLFVSLGSLQEASNFVFLNLTIKINSEHFVCARLDLFNLFFQIQEI